MLRRRLGDLLGDRILQAHQGIQRLRAHGAVGEHRQFAAHVGDPAAQLLGRPCDGRGRVVQLMGQTGRQLAQRQQLLAIVDQPPGAFGADGDAVEQVDRHRELVFHEVGERRCVQDEEPRRLGDVHRSGVELLLLAGKRLPRTAIHAAVRRPVGLDVLAAGELRHRQFALDQDVETGCRFAFDADRARLEMPRSRPSAHSVASCSSVRCLEQEKRAQFVCVTTFSVVMMS